MTKLIYITAALELVVVGILMLHLVCPSLVPAPNNPYMLFFRGVAQVAIFTVVGIIFLRSRSRKK